jgi:hypothetical protein
VRFGLLKRSGDASMVGSMHTLVQRCAREQSAEVARLVTQTGALSAVTAAEVPGVEMKEAMRAVLEERYRSHDYDASCRREVLRLAPAVVSWLESGMPAGARGSGGLLHWDARGGSRVASKPRLCDIQRRCGPSGAA